MRTRACTSRREGLDSGVIHVVLMIGRINIFAIPAAWEVVDLITISVFASIPLQISSYRHNPALARLRRKIRQLRESRILIRQANEAESMMTFCSIQRASSRRSNGHAEPLREGRDLLIAVAVEVLLGVVHRHTTIYTCGESRIFHNGDALVRSVVVSEVHSSGPVVAAGCKHEGDLGARRLPEVF